MIPVDVRYTKDHEWVRLAGNVGEVGITHHAQDQLGDVVFVELPSVGDSLEQGAVFGTVESVKAVSDLFAPVTGKVVEVNEALKNTPELVNSEPYGAAWMIKVELADPQQFEALLTPEQYETFLSEQ